MSINHTLSPDAPQRTTEQKKKEVKEKHNIISDNSTRTTTRTTTPAKTRVMRRKRWTKFWRRMKKLIQTEGKW